MDAEDTCGICLESLEAEGQGRQTLSCGHVLHELCILTMRQHGSPGRCPFCRAYCPDLQSVDELLFQGGLCHARSHFAEAARLLEEALTIEPSNAFASNNLGCLFLHGKGVEQNFEKALELFQEALNGGHAEAAHFLGGMYLDSQGVKENFKKAIELFEHAYAAKVPHAAISLGLAYLSGPGVAQNFERAVNLFEEAHTHGFVTATDCLGVLYLSGKGVAQNFKKARELFLEARLGGSKTASNSLGIMSQHGQGVEQDLRQAVGFFEEAHHHGSAEGTHNLALMYLPGHGIETNREKAIELFRQAFKRGYGDSAKCLAVLGGIDKNSQDVGQKTKKATDLSKEARSSASMVSHSWQHPEPHDLEAGIAASLADADASTASENGQIAEAILGSRWVASTVILLEFSRNPKTYHRALMGCDELRDCRDALTARGFKAELSSLAKVFVPPEMFEASMEAIRIAEWMLEARHVLVTPELEDTVKNVVKQALRNTDKVKFKGRHRVPLAFAEASLLSDQEIMVSRTFINVKIPSSLRSESTNELVTASTTDAHSRFGRNPRAM
ncbi:unnamed protein product [Polarella glacialis]|uniref:RING-type domain-containing protein n=2 Tax=Polarella glacialis TaxID=89957 RepID=A0A813HCH2_POLGL|nr:unnamed protein product [Polarella glacialis]